VIGGACYGVIQIFKRVEKKYLLNEEQYAELNDILLAHMSEDIYGLHTICNVYYDTEDYELIRRSMEKPYYKEKFRIRSYGVPAEDDIIFLEIKKKCNGVVYKRRVPFRYRIAMNILDEIMTGGRLYGNRFIEHGIGLEEYENMQILHEIEYVINHYGLSPKSYIAYDRTALFGKEDLGLRITFDRNIRTRFDALTLADGDRGNVILQPGLYLMEIKTNGSMPMWLATTLSAMKIYPYSFSKYSNAYKTNLEGVV